VTLFDSLLPFIMNLPPRGSCFPTPEGRFFLVRPGPYCKLRVLLRFLDGIVAHAPFHYFLVSSGPVTMQVVSFESHPSYSLR